MGLLDKLFGKAEPAKINEELPKQDKPKAEKKPRKPRQPKQKIEQAAEPAPAQVDPSVKVIGLEFDKDNPRLGSIELDWNPEFVSFLRTHGYTGANDEEVVDSWLMDLCRAMSGDVPDMYNVRYIQRRDLGGGKTEFS